MRSFEGDWNRSAEIGMTHSDERTTGIEEKMGGMQIYVNDFVSEKTAFVSSLVKQEFSANINGSRSAAELFARENNFLIPKEVKELGKDHEIAFVLKLAEELEKPEYNQ